MTMNWRLIDRKPEHWVCDDTFEIFEETVGWKLYFNGKPTPGKFKTLESAQKKAGEIKKHKPLLEAKPEKIHTREEIKQTMMQEARLYGVSLLTDKGSFIAFHRHTTTGSDGLPYHTYCSTSYGLPNGGFATEFHTYSNMNVKTLNEMSTLRVINERKGSCLGRHSGHLLGIQLQDPLKEKHCIVNRQALTLEELKLVSNLPPKLLELIKEDEEKDPKPESKDPTPPEPGIRGLVWDGSNWAPCNPIPDMQTDIERMKDLAQEIRKEIAETRQAQKDLHASLTGQLDVTADTVRRQGLNLERLEREKDSLKYEVRAEQKNLNESLKAFSNRIAEIEASLREHTEATPDPVQKKYIDRMILQWTEDLPDYVKKIVREERAKAHAGEAVQYAPLGVPPSTTDQALHEAAKSRALRQLAEEYHRQGKELNKVNLPLIPYDPVLGFLPNTEGEQQIMTTDAEGNARQLTEDERSILDKHKDELKDKELDRALKELETLRKDAEMRAMEVRKERRALKTSKRKKATLVQNMSITAIFTLMTYLIMSRVLGRPIPNMQINAPVKRLRKGKRRRREQEAGERGPLALPAPQEEPVQTTSRRTRTKTRS